MLALLIVLGLATFRATRVVTGDAFPPAKAFRDGVSSRYGESSWQAYLVECAWCASIYVAAAFVFGYDLADTLPGVGYTHVPVPFFVFLACSAVTGLVAVNLDGD